VSQSTGFYLLLTMNGIGVIGRVTVSLLGSRYGPLVLMVPVALFNALLGFCWVAVSGEKGLWAFTVFFGTAAACIQAVYPMVLGSFVEDPRKAGAITGMGFFVAGVAAFTGPPVAGVLIQVREGGYLGVQLMSGSSMVAAAVMYSICMVLRRRQGLQKEKESAPTQSVPRRQELMSA
jgi:predicted MFS family arabinose efflux permease